MSELTQGKSNKTRARVTKYLINNRNLSFVGKLKCKIYEKKILGVQKFFL